MQQAVKTEHEKRLTLAEVVDWLVEDKLVDAEAAAKLKKERRYYRGALHPLAIVAEQKWKSGAAALTLDYLAEWLAKGIPIK
jgi:general secretion pathway protein E